MSNEAKDILMEDYRHISEAIARNEQTGETRLNLFIGLIAIVIGALATVAKDTGLEKSIAVVVTGLLFLLVVGIATLIRIIKRNATTDRYVMRLDYIRQTFKDYFDEDGLLASYDPFRPPFTREVQQPDTGKANNGLLSLRGFHGLTLTVTVMNSFLCLLLGAVIFISPALSGKPPPGAYSVPVVIGILALIASMLVQRMWVNRKEQQSKQQSAVAKPTHGGGVVFEIRDGSPQFTLIQPRGQKDGTKWVLPKGHIEPLESPGEAAVREVREECGVVGQLGCLLGRIEFKAGEKVQDVKFYLIEKRYEVLPKENRGVQRFPFEEAIKNLTYPESRYLLEKANAVLLRRRATQKLPD